MKATKKEEAAILECYRRIYKKSSPSADFDKLLKDDKDIDFMSYEIDESLFNSILVDIIKEYKIAPKYRKDAFKATICLGVSPKFK